MSRIRKPCNYRNKRYKFIEFMKSIGKLRCSVCGCTEFDDRVDSEYSATIDHIVPISRGGSVMDEKNWRICCKKCNNERGNK